MLKPNVSVQEEVAKLILKTSKYRVRDFVLNLRWQVLVEWKLFNDEIIVVDEGVLDELFDDLIQLVWNLLSFVAILKS